MEAYLQIECPKCPSCGHVMWVNGDVIECITTVCADTTQYKRPVVELEAIQEGDAA